MNKGLFFLIVFIISNAVFGQVELITKASKTELYQNEKLTITFKFSLKSNFELNISSFKRPSFKGFEIYAGPFQTNSYFIENGDYSQNLEYKYVLLPTKPGKFIIDKASIKVDNELIYSDSLVIIVKEGRAEKTKSKGIISQSNNNIEDGVEIVLNLSNERPYLNEQIIASYYLYFKQLNIFNPVPTKFPHFTGFWSQEFKQSQSPEIQEINYKNSLYYRVLLRKLVLIPQKSGKLTIDSFDCNVPIKVATGRYDIFGRPNTTREVIKVSSGVKTIDVKELPLNGKPKDFSGAVGDFNLLVDLKDNTIRVNESVEIDIEVVGTGNFQLFEMPKPNVGAELELYEPKINNNFRLTNRGLKGKSSSSYVIVPRYSGEYKIPEFKFSYFNPKTNKYITKTSKPFILSVFGGAMKEFHSDTLARGGKSEVLKIDEDIRYIATSTLLVPKSIDRFFGSLKFLLLILLPILVILLAFPLKIFIEKVRIEDKSKRRKKVVKISLSKARRFLKTDNTVEFYTEIERALTEFICSKLNIDISEFTIEHVIDELKIRKLDDADINRFQKTFKDCQFERYTNSKDDSRMKMIYEQASKCIIQLDKRIS